ncbi:MAG: TRAP transporter substrate-binding protein [Bdellovibrionales bacterium]|nr:TRAP transporter substrate-binding protein [Bdellovibrionales bacterium]
MKTRRRDFVFGTTAAAAFLAMPRAAFAAKKIRWRLALAVPKTFPIWGEGVLRFAKNVEILTGGTLQIKVYGAGELVPALGTFDACKKGEIQMGHSAAYYHQGKEPAAPFFCSVPFGLNTQGMLAWLTEGGGQQLWDELMHPHGLQCFPMGGTGAQMTGWFNKEIAGVKDLTGLKIRIPGLAAQVYSRAGAKPVLLPGGEVFTGLATGVVDAVEWTDPYQDMILGLHKAAKYYYGACWHEPGPILELMLHKASWEALTEQHQLAIRMSAGEASQWMISTWSARQGQALDKLKKEDKVKIKEFPLEVLQELKKHSVAVKEEIASTSPLAEKIYQAYTKFQKSFEAYQTLVEKTYLQATRGSN